MATAQEIRQLNVDDLQRRANELRETLFDMKIKYRTGGLEKSAEIGKNKRELARVLTILSEVKRAAAKKA